MIVRVGWNSQFARKKFDVELDESDLRALVRECGLPEAALGVMGTAQKHALLKNEAELLSLEAAITGGVFSSEEAPGAAARLGELKAARAQMMTTDFPSWYARVSS